MKLGDLCIVRILIVVGYSEQWSNAKLFNFVEFKLLCLKVTKIIINKLTEFLTI